jgi:hypothetical protein
MWTLCMIGLGVIVGWQFPQPEIAKKAQAAIVTWAKAQWNAWVK